MENDIIWKDIKGYEGFYQVNNNGDIKSVNRTFIGLNNKKIVKNEHMLKPFLNKKGYPTVKLCQHGKQKTKTVHRIVAETFIQNHYNLPQVNHIDGNKLNNHTSNLEWCTAQDNVIHAWEIGLKKTNKNSGRKCKEVLKIDIQTGEIIDRYESASEAARLNNGSQGTISSCCRGESKFKTYKGYIWKYAKSDKLNHFL